MRGLGFTRLAKAGNQNMAQQSVRVEASKHQSLFSGFLIGIGTALSRLKGSGKLLPVPDINIARTQL